MLPEGWRENYIADIAKIDVARDLNEGSFSPIQTPDHQFEVYSNTVQNRGLYGYYNYEEYTPNCLTVVGRGIGLGTAFSRVVGFGAIGRLLVLSPKNKSFDPYYLAEYINFKIRIYFENGAIPQLPGSTFGRYKVTLPPLAEQRKIAEILSVWDRAIAVVEKLIANAKAQKKALMQQLLTGQKRLPGFTGEWNKLRLADCANSLDSRRVPINDAQRQLMQGPIPYYGANGILDHVNDHLFDQPIVLLAEDGGYFDEYATRPIAQLVRGKCWVNNHAHILSNKPNSTIEWIFYSLVHRNILDFINGGTRAKLNKADMLKIPMQVPSVKEQSEICEILSGVEMQITLLEAHARMRRQEKSALMQQLLTGKRRVKVEGEA